jgi:hypothetical protein
MANEATQRFQKTGLIFNDSHKIDKANVVHSLYRRAPRASKKEMPKFQNYPSGFHQQADLLYLPEDPDGSKYALVVVEVGYPRLCDAEPLKSKFSKDVMEAFKVIYKRKILNMPKNITMDSGTEFKSEVKDYFDKNKVNVTYGDPDRHRQLAIVENRNKTIASAIFRVQANSEIQTKVPNKDWVKVLPGIIQEMNKHAKTIKVPKVSSFPVVNSTMLQIGDTVRKQMDAPREVLTTGKRLTGKFRATDIRWSPHIFTITNMILFGNQVPLYSLDNKKTPLYSKDQLQVVSTSSKVPEPVPATNTPASKQPQKKPAKPQSKEYEVEKILKQRTRKGHKEYLVKWKGYSEKESTWEPESHLKNSPKILKEFQKGK